MTATPPRYRTLARPGPGLATIEEPDGRVMVWALNLRLLHPHSCAQCGRPAGRGYRPSLYRGKDTPRLCRPCVEGMPDAVPSPSPGAVLPPGAGAALGEQVASARQIARERRDRLRGHSTTPPD